MNRNGCYKTSASVTYSPVLYPVLFTCQNTSYTNLNNAYDFFHFRLFFVFYFKLYQHLFDMHLSDDVLLYSVDIFEVIHACINIKGYVII